MKSFSPQASWSKYVILLYPEEYGLGQRDTIKARNPATLAYPGWVV
ncbi:hypothetical protein [Acetobacter sicerae]|nr:hypothetical protein [Acetobacter sicerae]NHN92178.1 hypothetical protein [Acetobacter sicerae]